MFQKRPTFAVVFLLPALALYALITLYPLARGAWLSLTDSTGAGSSHYVGLQNYRELFHDQQAVAALKNTLIYSATVVFFQNFLGLLFAVWLMSMPRVRAAVRVVLLTPAILAPVIAGYVFSYIYSTEGGINAVLKAVGISARQYWLAEPGHAIYAIAAVHVWMFAGYSCAIFLASYIAIPTELIEAARIDGASGWSRFRHVEWPLLAPALTITVTLSIIGTLRVFDLPLVMTGGGPANSTMTLSLLIYTKVFKEFAFGYGAALSVVLLVLVIVISSAASALLRIRETRMA